MAGVVRSRSLHDTYLMQQGSGCQPRWKSIVLCERSC
jgi:hypothetical protein